MEKIGTVLIIAELQKRSVPKVVVVQLKGTYFYFIRNKRVGDWMIKNIIIGSLAGLTCGIFGTGGGMILVPSMVYILKIAFICFLIYASYNMIFI